MSNTRIVNKTGLVKDTKVYVDGVEMRGVKSIVIDPIVAVIIPATIEVYLAELEVVANVSN